MADHGKDDTAKGNVEHLNRLSAMVLRLDAECPWCAGESASSVLGWLNSEAAEVEAALKGSDDAHLESGKCDDILADVPRYYSR